MLGYLSMGMFEQDDFRNPIEFLSAERRQCQSMEQYLYRLRRLYHAAPWFGRIFNMAVAVEPTTGCIGRESNTPIASAFFNGSLIGLRVVDQCVPGRVKERIPQVDLGVPLGIGARSHDIRTHTGAIIEYSRRGAATFPELTEFVKGWEEDITPDITRQPYVRHGLGFIMHVAVEANTIAGRAADLAVMATEISDAGSWDWSAGLDELS